MNAPCDEIPDLGGGRSSEFVGGSSVCGDWSCGVGTPRGEIPAFVLGGGKSGEILTGNS